MISRLPFIALAFATVSLSAEEVRIAASDLLGELIKAPLEAYGAENDIQFDVETIGSLPAVERLESDEIDLAIIAVPETQEVPRDQFRVYPFAYDAAVIAVNESNPLDEISLERLGGIFGSNEEFNYNSWGDMGLSGWGNRSIKPLAGEIEGSISLELFKFTVFRGGAMKVAVDIVKDEEVEEMLQGDAASIAILSRMPKERGVKALLVASTQGAPAFGPSEDNIHFGDYPIRLPFYIIFNPRDELKLKDVLRFLLGSEIANVLNENHLIALPDTVRRQLTIDLDMVDNGL